MCERWRKVVVGSALKASATGSMIYPPLPAK
jgi:hypothetical protein